LDIGYWDIGYWDIGYWILDIKILQMSDNQYLMKVKTAQTTALTFLRLKSPLQLKIRSPA
jgi:hypothetical protein